jgi:ArsR family transcriptional regulator, arsenate/arsenite/antimonite-responsive transcriptional repressor
MSAMCDKIQQLGKGIASPTRYRIVEVLMEGPTAVSDIVIKVKLTQPAVSQHLRTLKSCGLVQSTKRGQEVYYSLNARYMLDLLKYLASDVQKCKASKAALV